LEGKGFQVSNQRDSIKDSAQWYFYSPRIFRENTTKGSVKNYTPNAFVMH
jgi:hypothetical protein